MKLKRLSTTILVAQTSVAASVRTKTAVNLLNSKNSDVRGRKKRVDASVARMATENIKL